MKFAVERYHTTTAFKPLLSTAHLAPNVADSLAVEVGVGKGSGFTPPLGLPCGFVWRKAAVRHSRQVSQRDPERVRIKSVTGSSRPQILHFLVSISEVVDQRLLGDEAIAFGVGGIA